MVEFELYKVFFLPKLVYLAKEYFLCGQLLKLKPKLK